LFVINSPSSLISPAWGKYKPMIVFASVDLPLPFPPTKNTSSPV